MKPFYLIPTLFMVTTASAITGKLYAKINGTLTPLTGFEWPNYQMLAPSEANFPPVPKLTLEYGIITTDQKFYHDVFSIVEDYLVIGDYNKLKPFKLQLDDKSRVLNIDTHFCKWLYGNFQTFFMRKNHSSINLKCSPVNIYFLSSIEAKKRIGTGKKVKN